MKDAKEFCSNSLKDAITKAALEFDVAEELIKYEIIAEKTRYFGHVNREIYIRAWASDGMEQDNMKEFLSMMIENIGINMTFDVIDAKGYFKVLFKGPDYKLVLYQNASLLNAIQYLINRLYADLVGKKIYCECENFRKTREQELVNLAHRYAKEVRKTGKPVSLRELNPFERRIVHMTINKYTDLESKSDGIDFNKVISIRRRKANGA